MKRNLNDLSNVRFDLLVIGGGMYGACVAWEASRRGLTTALVEKEDFGSATSANSLKTIHGGLRYLQSADLRRMRQSITERKILLRIAPHLVHPMPVIVPTYGHGIKGKELMQLALKVNDLVSFDRNFHLDDPQKHIPSGQIIDRSELQKLIPGISTTGLTGGVLFHDAQVYNSERLTLAFIQSAAENGANVANYVEVVHLLHSQGRVTGAKVRDTFTKTEFDIQANTVVNTSGPWISCVSDLLGGRRSALALPLAKAINLVTRPLFKHSCAVGLASQAKCNTQDKVFKKGSRLFFIAPWRGKSLVGTAYSPYEGSPDSLSITEKEITEFIQDVNQAYPPAQLQLQDVSFVHRGLLPRSRASAQIANVQLTKHYQLYDHRQDGVAGLLSVVGVKYTTARGVAEKAVDWVMRDQGRDFSSEKSSDFELYGGKIKHFKAFLQEALNVCSRMLPESSVSRLVYNYGSSYHEVLRFLEYDFSHAQTFIDDLEVYRAEVKYAVHREMAQKLSDFIFRRGELGTSGMPEEVKIRACADVMKQELGWDSLQARREIEEVTDYFKKDLIRFCEAA